MDISDLKLAVEWNDRVGNPTIESVADAMDTSQALLLKKVHTIRGSWLDGCTEVVSLEIREGESKVLDKLPNEAFLGEPEIFLAEIRRLQWHNPDTNITRKFFRENSSTSERQIYKFFGNFNEYRKQSGISPDNNLLRQTSKLNSQIAKHAAHDMYREADIRHNWGEDYCKSSDAKYQTILSCNDVHDIDCDPFWRRVFVDTARRAQPDIIVFNGDLFDCPEFGKYPTDPRDWDVVGRIKWVWRLMEELREACPDAQIDVIEGNHEYRVTRLMQEKAPMLQVLLEELHGFDLRKLFGLDKFEVNYISKARLATFTEAEMRKEVSGQNYKLYYDCYLFNHTPEARNWGYPGQNGHNHKFLAWAGTNVKFGSITWLQLGCAHMLDAGYCNAEMVWNQGFSLVHVNTKSKFVNAEYIPITDNAVVGGKLYERQPGEMVGWYYKRTKEEL